LDRKPSFANERTGYPGLDKELLSLAAEQAMARVLHSFSDDVIALGELPKGRSSAFAGIVEVLVRLGRSQGESS